MTVEIACRDLVFHFNKAYLTDPTIPMWVVKTRGKTYYVNHVEANLPWTTKETPDNSHTKGSIKFKNCLCVIDANNCAHLSVLTNEDRIRLGAIEKEPSIVWMEGSRPNLAEVLEQYEIAHQGVLKYSGTCTTTKQMAGIYEESHLSILLLRIPGLRILNENEMYYNVYKRWSDQHPDAKVGEWDEDYDDEYDDDEEEDDDEPLSERWTNPQGWKQKIFGR